MITLPFNSYFKKIIFILSIILCAVNSDGASWQSIGIPGVSAGYSINTKIATAPDGTTYIAYINALNKVNVMKFTGGIWQIVGYSDISSGNARDLSLAIATNGTLYVGFEDTSIGYYRATVMRFNGVSWEYVGAPGFSNGEAIGLKLAISSDGMPYVAYRDYLNQSSVIVKKFNYSAWVTVGSPNISNGYVEYVSLALSPNGTPYVAYSYNDVRNYKKQVKMFDGCNWESVGISDFTMKNAYHIDLKISENSTPYIAFNTSNNNVVVSSLNNYNWKEIGSIAYQTAKPISMAIRNNIPYVAFQDFNIGSRATVITFMNNEWRNIGTIAFSPVDAAYIDLTVAANGTPYVVYKDTMNVNKASVMSYF